MVYVEISDHMPVFAVFNHTGAAREISYDVRKVDDVRNIDNFVALVRQIDFYDCDYNNLDDLATHFMNKMYESYRLAFPVKRVRINSRYNRRSEWITDNIRPLIVKKHKLFKLSNMGAISRRSYVKYRNLLTSLIQKAKNVFYLTKLSNNNSQPREIWKQINEVLNRNLMDRTITVENSGVEVDLPDVPNMFNDYFSSIASKLVEE